MAVYNTLDRFPFPRPHASPDAANPLRVSLEKMTRWYWQVKRWTVTMTFSGSASGPFTDSATGTINATNVAGSYDFIGGDQSTGQLMSDPGADETLMLRVGPPDNGAGYGFSRTSDINSATYDSITGTNAGASPSPSAYADAQFDLFGNFDGIPRIAYDPATQLFQPRFYDPAVAGYTIGAVYGGIALSVRAGSIPTDPRFTYGAIFIPFSMDGETFSLPGYYEVDGLGDSATASVSSVQVTITPVEFWSWGGKYDTTTGAPL